MKVISMKRQVVVMGMALAMVAIPPIAKAQPSPYAIVPGRSLGPVELGMRMDEVIGLLGTPMGSFCVRPLDCEYWWQAYDNAGNLDPGSSSPIQVQARRGVVYEISVDDRRYITVQGIHVDSTEHQVRRAFGPPKHIESSTITAASTVHWHTLWYPGMRIETQYVPGNCRDPQNSACWIVSWIAVFLIDNSPRT